MGLFEGKGDAKGNHRGLLRRFSESIKDRRDKKQQKRETKRTGSKNSHDADWTSTSSDEADQQVESYTNSFIEESQLGDFVPSGHADISVVGTTPDAALDLDFKYNESIEEQPTALLEGNALPQASDAAPTHPQHHKNIDMPVHHMPQRQSMDNIEAGTVPKLNICMLVCGTRGDVQPFIALGITLKEYGHRVRLATHKDYRDFVTKYGLEFYPLGGDPKILSDFIVKHRGVFTVNTKDAKENINQVEEIVFSCYDACIQPDPEDPKKRPFVAEAIIGNPPSYGHIHVAEKMQIPCHIFFTMPWTPTRNFPHPLARIPNVRDTRPHSIAVRNYLSYLVVNEYTYTGLFSIFNSFREKKLGLEPVRFGSSGATLLDAHDVPFSYCWSPSLIAKPDDWDDHIDVTGYFFLNEGTRSKFEPPKALADFLAKGPPPVYLGFGSLMVDDRERLTKKILKAFEETGNRLLMSKGWAGLGEGFDLPDTVMLLDDVPHDWLLPQCCAAIHHGGAGTTAASLLAACPTLVIPFFGDQQFWGSASYRRGVGPKPIPIDSFTTKKLVAALKFMEKPEVKAEADKISAQIKSENGVKNGMDAFHKHLPLADMKAGKPTVWNLSKPTMGAFVHELAGGIGDIFWQPVKGAKAEGVKGAFKGVGKGLYNSVARPVRGAGLAGVSVWQGVSGSTGPGPKCLSNPQTKSFKESSTSGTASENPENLTKQTSAASNATGNSDISRTDSDTSNVGGMKLFRRRFLFNTPQKAIKNPSQDLGEQQNSGASQQTDEATQQLQGTKL